MRSTRSRLILVGVAIALVVAGFASFLASPDPDGLERVAEDQGFIERAEDAPYNVLPDYTVPGLGEGPASTVVAGAIGVLLVTGVTMGAGAMLRRRREGR